MSHTAHRIVAAVVMGAIALAQAPAAAQAGLRDLPLRRFAWSREAHQDARGFYHQPVALCDDYPEETTTPAKIRRDLATMKAAGVKLLRFGIGWDGVEEAPGRYNWRFWDALVDAARREGVTLLPYVCYTPRWLGTSETDYWHEPPKDLAAFGRFMKVIAARYKGRIASWELWNEPDLKAYWLGSPAQFAEMAKEGARQVRAADPAAVVVLGGMSNGRGPFLDALMERHGMGGHVDVLNVHGYHETWHPEAAEAYAERLDGMAALLPRTGPRPDLWLAEFGYSDWRFKPSQVSQWGVDAVYAYEHTARFQADALIRHHALALATGSLSLTAWYRINDLPPAEGVIGDDNNKHLGLVDVKGRPKPAFRAMKLWTGLLDRPVRVIDADLGVEKEPGSAAEVHAFERRDGVVVVTAWLRGATREDVDDRSGMARDDRLEGVTIRLPRSFRRGERMDAVGDPASGGVLEGPLLRGVTLRGGETYVGLLTP